MNKTTSLLRIATLFTLAVVASLLILGEEKDTNLLTWAFRMVIDKALGLGLAFLIARLYKRWSRVDPWLMAYERMCDEVM